MGSIDGYVFTTHAMPTYSSSWFIKEGHQTTFVFMAICIKNKLNIIIILNTLINTSYICCNQYIYFDMPPEITPSPCAKCICGSRLPMSISDAQLADGDSIQISIVDLHQ